MERLCIFIHIYNKPYISLWPIRSQFDMDLARAPRRARLTARKKGSGYENVPRHIVRQFQSPYTPSPRGLSRISARQVALALASRFSRMLSFQINKRHGVHCHPLTIVGDRRPRSLMNFRLG